SIPCGLLQEYYLKSFEITLLCGVSAYGDLEPLLDNRWLHIVLIAETRNDECPADFKPAQGQS
ncbi:MAG: hypothetical protein AAFX50_02450, partial [Acidobacteriota bacterium]